MTKIALSGPADLLATIPYHLGFYPSRSVVVVCFHENRLGLLARLDALSGEQVDHAVEALLPVLRREAPTSVTLVSFEMTPGETLPLHQALADGVGTTGILVREQLLVRDRRWFSLDCTGPCCPPEGLPMPQDADVPAVAAFVGLGQAVLTDRESMARLVAPLPSENPGPGHDAAVRHIERWQQRYSWSLITDSTATSKTGSVNRVASFTSLSAARPTGRGSEQRRQRQLVDEALGCWRVLLSPELDDDLLPALLPQLVAPLRFAPLRDAIIAWLCPGAMPLTEVDPSLVAQLEARLGPDLRGAAARDGDTGEHVKAPPVVASWPPLAPLAPGPNWTSPEPAPMARDGRVVSSGGVDGDWDAALASRLVQSRLTRLCRETPSAHAAPVLAVLACYAWWSGDGTLAGMAVDQALQLEGDHRLCGLVRSALDHGLRAMGTAA